MQRLKVHIEGGEQNGVQEKEVVVVTTPPAVHNGTAFGGSEEVLLQDQAPTTGDRELLAEMRIKE